MQPVGGRPSLAVVPSRVKARDAKSASTAGSCRKFSALLGILLVCLAPAARAEDDDRARRLAEIAADFSDPLTTLPQLFLTDAYTTEHYGTKARGNRLIARAIVPRVPETSLLPFVQLIRPTVSLVTVPDGPGRSTVTAFGDAQLLDLGVIPWPARKTGLFMGLGPTFVFPTASQRIAGQGAWQVGPAFAAVYKGIPGLLLGCLIQNPISFAYTSSSRPAVSTLLVQPIALVYLGRGFYLRSVDATWTRGWLPNSPKLLPLSLGLGWVSVREGWPPINVFASFEWSAYRRNAPVASKSTFRVGMTVAFPDWRPW